MKCPRCQHENPTSSSFCLECGARLGLTCASCGTDLPVGSKFCNKCGTAVSGPTAGQPRFASPESYTPKHLAERILNSKTALEGERKQVTVLFADLKGSMELLADRDPEEARKILDPVLEHMMEAVHRYEGTVNQVMGDGIMALFGAPLAHEDHAVRACYAALRMQESVKRYAEEVRRREGALPQIRVGLNSGEAIVRSIGSDLHMDYTAVGQTTHLAARMEQMAAAGSILLAAATLRSAEGYVQVKPLGAVAVKGLGEPIEIFELVGAGLARTRLQAAAARGLTRFVGRDVEVEAIHQALAQAQAGHGQIVALVGEPGVGKSRLVWEVTHSHRVHDWLILESGSVSYGRATVYLPVIDLLRAYFQIANRDDTRKIREKVTGKLLTLDETLGQTLHPLLALLDVPIDDAGWQALDPPQRRQRTLDAVKRLLLRESRVQPLLLVFEDLHWIDGESQALLDGLVESLPTARVLLLVNYRPEYEHRWGSRTHYTQLRLDPLPAESAHELLRGLLGEDAALDPLRARLIDRTEGNPLFLEESVQTLIETGVLTGERGAHRLTKSLTDIKIPATVQAILAARIDRLLTEEKGLLQSAAVIGKDVPFPLLAAIAEQSEERLRQGLAHLQSAEFIYETRIFPDTEYTFKHALTHEVAYGGLLQERRRRLHGRIVDAIERLYADRLAEHVDRLAHHAERGEVWEKAARYSGEAGHKAAVRGAHREAVAAFEQAVAAVGRLPETPDRQAQAIDLRLDARNSLVPLGDFAGVLGHLLEAERLAETLGDQGRQAAIAGALAHCLWATGQFEPALEPGERALELATRAGAVPEGRSATFVLGELRYALGDYQSAIALFADGIAIESHDETWRWRRYGSSMFSVQNRRWLAQSLAEVGRFPEGIVLATEAVEIAEQADHPYALSNALVGLGFVLLRQGDVEQAIRVLGRCVDVCRRLSFRSIWPNGAALLAEAYGLCGRVAEADAMLAQPRSDRAHLSLTGMLAESCLLAGCLDEARELGPQELESARARKARGREAWVCRLLAELAAHREVFDVEAAEIHYRQALALASELGMRPLIAHCHLGLGKLYRRTGKREQAQEHLTTATTMYREMGMTYWLEKAEKEMG
jgi:class 3 adenylate cyclase/tetratricopeptide (TPR) repeat protein